VFPNQIEKHMVEVDPLSKGGAEYVMCLVDPPRGRRYWISEKRDRPYRCLQVTVLHLKCKERYHGVVKNAKHPNGGRASSKTIVDNYLNECRIIAAKLQLPQCYKLDIRDQKLNECMPDQFVETDYHPYYTGCKYYLARTLEDGSLTVDGRPCVHRVYIPYTIREPVLSVPTDKVE
jgi:hypothetical protein